MHKNRKKSHPSAATKGQPKIEPAAMPNMATGYSLLNHPPKANSTIYIPNELGIKAVVAINIPGANSIKVRVKRPGFVPNCLHTALKPLHIELHMCATYKEKLSY